MEQQKKGQDMTKLKQILYKTEQMQDKLMILAAKQYGDGANPGAITDIEEINKFIFEIEGEKFIFINDKLSKEQWDAVIKSGAILCSG